MDTSRRSVSRLAGALLLIFAGIVLFVAQFIPEWERLISGGERWPLGIVGVGFLLLMIGLVSGAPGMAVPACVVSGIGGLLWWQNATGDWHSWAYVWTLVPGFAGVGLLLSGILQWRRDELKAGVWLIFVSAMLFGIFGSALGRIALFGPYWPALLIAFGAVLLVRALVRRW